MPLSPEPIKKVQFSLVLRNKTAELTKLSTVLAEAKVNLEALSISDGVHTGVAKLVADKPDAARQALLDARMQFSEQEVLAVPLANSPGALAELCQKLSANNNSIDCVYGSSAPDGEQSDCFLMLSVADLSAAETAVGMVASGWPRP